MKFVRNITHRFGGASTMFAYVLLAALILIAIVAPPLFAEQASTIDVDSAGLNPSAEHWLGTNALGQDIGLRVLAATRLSLLLALAATVISVGLGILLGAAPTLFGRAVGKVVDSVISVSIAFPGLLLVLFLAVIFGVSTVGAVFAIGIAGVPYKARLVRNLVRSVESRDYVSAARIGGAKSPEILLRHILPNIAEPLIINTATSAGGAVLSFAGLSFLGIGVQAPTFDWGQLIHDGQRVLYSNPLAVIGPGLAVVIAGLALNILGDSAARQLAFGGTSDAIAKDKRGSTERSTVATTAVSGGTAAALHVSDLHVTYRGDGRTVRAVRGIDLTIGPGEAVGIVGESGSGKSTVALAVAQLMEYPTVVNARELSLEGRPLIGSKRVPSAFLAEKLSVVFQDPMSSFNPVRRIGTQLTDGDRYHRGLSRSEAIQNLVRVLERVGIKRAETRVMDYPHEFSGGMRQRAMIATALTQSPALIIADELSTALDVTTEAKVLEYLSDVQRETGAALLLISHDLSVIRRVTDRVVVMYAGKIVEDMPVSKLSSAATHPYTLALLSAVPSIEKDRSEPLTPIPGRIPDMSKPISGCAFASRCAFATEKCRAEDPVLSSVAPGHEIACWYPRSADITARSEHNAMERSTT